MASKKKQLKPGEKVLLLLTEEEADFITNLPYIPEELFHGIYGSKCRDGIVSARFTLSELEELGECIAAEANNTKNRKWRKGLDAVSEKIDLLNLTYSDETPPIQATTKRHLVLVKK